MTDNISTTDVIAKCKTGIMFFISSSDQDAVLAGIHPAVGLSEQLFSTEKSRKAYFCYS